MVQFRHAIYFLGVILSFICVLMCIPMIIDIINADDTWRSFFNAILTTVFISGLLISATRSDERITYTQKDSILALILFWTIVPILTTLPLAYSALPFGICDSYFETVSALTTTGSTALYSLNSISSGMIIWKALLSITGACTFIISSTYIAKSVYCASKLHNGQFFIYATNFDEKNIFRNIKSILLTFSLLVIVGTVCIVVSGNQNIFESFFISSAILSTTGIQFSELTFDGNYYLTTTYILLLLVSGLPITLIKRGIKHTFQDLQVIVFFIFIAAFSVLLFFTYTHYETNIYTTIYDTIIETLSSITTNSASSTTGLHTLTYLLTVIGGCSGSASGGIKIFRIIVIFYFLKKATKKFINTEENNRTTNNKLNISVELEAQVITYFFLLVIFILFGSYALSYTGLQLNIAIEYAYSAITNNSIGILGSSINASEITSLPTITKLLLATMMIVGRIELVIIPAILSKKFWFK